MLKVNNKTYYKQKIKAVTFIEVLIALAVIMLAILPSMNIFTMFKKYTLSVEDIQIALRLAQEKNDEYRALSYSELKALIKAGKKNPEHDILVSNQTNATGFRYDDPIYKKFKRKVTISFLNNDENMIIINTHVWWYEGNFSAGDQRFVTLCSLVCNDLVL